MNKRKWYVGWPLVIVLGLAFAFANWMATGDIDGNPGQHCMTDQYSGDRYCSPE
jgi:hypothetical protein